MWVIALNVVFSSVCDWQQPIFDALGQPICAHHSDGADGHTQQSHGTDGGGLCCQCCTSLVLTHSGPTLELPVIITWTRLVHVAVHVLLPRPSRHPAGSPRGPPLV